MVQLDIVMFTVVLRSLGHSRLSSLGILEKIFKKNRVMAKEFGWMELTMEKVLARYS